VLFASILGVNTMLFWMPQIIKQISGAGNVQTGWLAALPWATFAAGLLILARAADRMPNPLPLLSAGFLVAAAGFGLSSAAGLGQLAMFAGLLLGAFGIGAAQGLFWGYAMKKVAGPAAATAYGVITVIGNGSGIFAHSLIGWARDASGSFGGVVLALSAFMAAAIVVLYAVDRFTRAHADARPAAA
jgi:MFS family permease